MDDPEHAIHRKMWNPAFTQAYMAVYLPLIQRVIAQRTHTWSERGIVDVYAESREIAFDVAAGVLAGFETGPEVDRLRQLFYTMLHGYDPARDTLEQFRERRNRTRNDLVGLLLGMITQRRREPPTAQPRDVLSLIVHARDETGHTFTDAQVLAHLNILLIAGHETTTTLGAWTLYLLATKPEHRQRVQDELDTILGAEGALTIEAVRAMRALDNFTKEAGRLYSPVLNVPRGVVEDVEFGGYTIPAGASVRLALAATHRLPHVFANPDTFDPDRFAAPREEDKRTQYALVTFGGGPRICIGINVAQVEVKALVAQALRAYDLEPVAGQTPIHAGYWTAEIPGGIKLRVAERSA